MIERDDVRIDLLRRTVEVRDEPVRLTFVEFELLALLARSPVSSSHAASCWNVAARRVRLPRAADDRRPRAAPAEKIEREPAAPELIRTVRGVGYRFGEGVEASARGSSDGHQASWRSPARDRRRLARRRLAIVVPQLENRLVAAKLSSMERDAVGVAVSLPVDQFSWDLYAEKASVATGARVVVFSVLSRTPITLASLGDSRADASTDVEDDPVALRSAETRSVTRGRVTRGGREYARGRCARAARCEVVLLSTSLADQLATVELVQRRLFEAALVALALAATSGTLAAGCTRGGSAASSAPRTGSRQASSRSRSSTGRATSSASSPRRSTGCASSSRSSTLPAGEFVANASHELRTPLFSLSGFLELLADEDLDEPTRTRFLATMREQVDRLTKLATDLLDLSRMDAGRLRVEREDVDLGEAARTLADELHGLAESRGHRLEVEVESDVWALADEERVLQIGRALAGNALVHTPAGTQVTLRRSPRRPAQRVRGGRRRTGDPCRAARPHLRPVSPDRGRLASGSGLGLAIARELVERMGGDARGSLTSGQHGVHSIAARCRPARADTDARRAGGSIRSGASRPGSGRLQDLPSPPAGRFHVKTERVVERPRGYSGAMRTGAVVLRGHRRCRRRWLDRGRTRQRHRTG